MPLAFLSLSSMNDAIRPATSFEARRYPWVDLIKAAGILAVIWIHAFNNHGRESTLLVLRLSTLSRFAVPAFFLASGFLQASGRRMSAGDFVTRRLRRLLVPYFVASTAAIAFRTAVLGESFDTATLSRMFLLGDAWGIYYFVPVLVVFSIVGEWLFRFPRLAWLAWLVLTILGIMAYQLYFYPGSFAAELRNPLRWAGWFSTGWVLAVERHRIDGLTPGVRSASGWALLMAAAACYAVIIVVYPPTWSRATAALEYLLVEGLVVGAALLAWQGPTSPVVRWLSEASYPIYLQHYFMIVVLQRLAGWQDRPLLVFSAAVPLTLAAVAVSSWACGSWAGLLIGTPSRKPSWHGG